MMSTKTAKKTSFFIFFLDGRLEREASEVFCWQGKGEVIVLLESNMDFKLPF